MDLGVRLSGFSVIFLSFFISSFIGFGKSLAVKKIWQGLWLNLGGVF